MITVSVETRNSEIVKLKLKGHAGFADYGKDIVCAGVSCITYGLLNAIDLMTQDSCNIISNDKVISIEVNENSEKLQNILNTGLIQYKTVEECYPDFIKIIMEVGQ